MRISYLNEDDNVWEKPITLYNNEYIYDKYINDFSASVTNDGDINVLLNVSEVNENYNILQLRLSVILGTIWGLRHINDSISYRKITKASV